MKIEWITKNGLFCGYCGRCLVAVIIACGSKYELSLFAMDYNWIRAGIVKSLDYDCIVLAHQAEQEVQKATEKFEKFGIMTKNEYLNLCNSFLFGRYRSFMG